MDSNDRRLLRDPQECSVSLPQEGFGSRTSEGCARMDSLPLPQLPERPDDAHKGTFGRLLIIGGSTGMSGAVSLAGMSALRSGAGLVYLAVPSPALTTVASMEPAYLTIPLPADSEGRIAGDALASLQDRAAGMDAIGLGPGLGRSNDLDRIVSEIYQATEVPLVVDADGLNALADHSEIIARHVNPRILTPHPGEFARLVNRSIAEVQKNREELSVEFARENNVVLVLKGPGTIVTNGTDLYINSTGNSGMATGGTGDVLTGMIVSLLAQSMSPFASAQLAVFVHGLAGDLAAEELTPRSMIATDLIDYLPVAWKSLNEFGKSGL